MLGLLCFVNHCLSITTSDYTFDIFKIFLTITPPMWLILIGSASSGVTFEYLTHEIIMYMDDTTISCEIANGSLDGDVYVVK
jgi:hypothetical protein